MTQQAAQLALSESTPYGGAAFGPTKSFASDAAANAAMNAAINPGMQLTNTGNLVPVPAPVQSTPAQSNAPTPAVVSSPPSNPYQVAPTYGPNGSQQVSVYPNMPAQSNAPGASTVTPVVATSTNCFALFGNEPCIGPVGMYTLVAGGLGALLLFGLMGGKH